MEREAPLLDCVALMQGRQAGTTSGQGGTNNRCLGQMGGGRGGVTGGQD